MADDIRKPLRFTTHRALTQRLVLATLTGRPILISNIRASALHPGLAAHEVSFLRLLENLTNGSHIEISLTGTTLLYRPGLLTGTGPLLGAPGLASGAGGILTHEIPASCTRGISYFLLPLCQLAPFAAAPVHVRFTGAGVITAATTTSSSSSSSSSSNTTTGDMSADSVRTAILPLFAHFGMASGIELRIIRRSNASPVRRSSNSDGGGGGGGGGGEVELVFKQQVRLPKTIHILNAGRVKRVRGVAYATGVAASNNARSIEAARGVLNPLVADTYIYSDVTSAPWGDAGAGGGGAKRKTGLGYGLSLVAESSTGALYSADAVSAPAGSGSGDDHKNNSSNNDTPEDIGRRAAFQLLETIAHGGAVPLAAAPSVMILMAMGAEDVGRVCLGRDALGSEAMVGLARDLRAFGAGGWAVRDMQGNGRGDGEDESGEVLVSVVGRGVGNVGRKIA